MRFHPARWLPRGARAAVLALAGLAMSSAAAHAAGSVRIVPVGGAGARTVDLAQLKPDVHDRSYTAVATPGGVPKVVTVTSGYSLPELFQALRIPPSRFGSAEIAAPIGPPVVLTSTQATSLFAYHSGPVVVWEDAAGAHLLVPSAPSGITNAGETFTGPGGTITIALHRNPPLNVGISGLPPKPALRRPVAFSATVYPASAPYHYRWSFGDGTSSSQPAPTHVYKATGTYNVSLYMTGSQDSVGASPVIQIVVGAAARRAPPRFGGTSGKGNRSTGGAGTRGAGTGGAGGARSGKGAGTAKTSAPKRSAPHKAPRPRGPVGPLVSGIAISYVLPAAPATPARAGGTRASRNEQLAPRPTGFGEGLWIALGVLALLLGGALLEWNGGPRIRPATSRAR